ncbi:DDT domain-containing protein [Micractinium conductrix]|uniref:DDT domain-containing protein n=1 Tax=Micractinium conductrix TaxID=554055 RepID=A0A2P6V4P2_9CHLO|nr:DDT domain-containing protein [Micractinium conductrix]|eukprot:PSC69056.1 DDT domain-containing protein [Micractinium conductrix]
MPLLNRKPWQPAAPPSDLSPEEQVWVMESTGEVFRSYEAFLQKKELYGQAVFSCRYSGKGSLTLEEALAAEKKAVEGLAPFPAHLEEQVCRAVHHSTARVDELVASIYDDLRTAAVAADAGAAQGEQKRQEAEQPSPLGSKENHPQQGSAGGEAPTDKPAAGGEAAEEPAGGEGGPEPATAKKAEGGAAGEQRSGRKAKTPKAPVSRPLLRTYIIENAEQQGPEHATKLAWVVKPALRGRYGLAAELPAAVAEALAASVKPPKQKKQLKLDAPKGLGTKLPGKKEGKKAAEGADGGAAAGEGSAAKEPKEKVPLVRVEAKSLEEVEKQYKEGTLKHALVAVLKAVQPEALTAAGIAEKAKELGIREFDEKQTRNLAPVLANDPNFLRISKGTYSLHCFHPDKEQLVKAVQPKEPKESKKAAATPAAGKKGGEGEGEGDAAKTPKVPLVRVEAKSLEEVEKQYKEGTLKHALVAVLKAVQPEALTAAGIAEKAKELGIREFDEKQTRNLAPVLANDPNFLRISKGTYSLHCFHPDKEQLVKAVQPKEPKESKKAAATPAAGKKGGEGEGEGDAAKTPKVPLVRVEAKSLEEVEKQYKEGTLKHALVAVLKAVQPGALTVQGMVVKGKEMGLSVLEEKQKSIGGLIAVDPNFLRISKGAYSLHCFHPDKEQLVKAPEPKKEGEDTPAAKTPSVPMVQVQAKTVEEVEKQYKEGTVKHGLMLVLKAVQPEALNVPAIVEKGKEMGLSHLEEKKQSIANALTSDPNFLHISMGAYSLHCFHPDKEQWVKAPETKEGEDAAKEGKQAKPEDRTGMVKVDAKPWEEVEKQYKEGTLKYHLVRVLKAVQPEALTAAGMVEKAQELGIHMFEGKQKSGISPVLANDPNFLRISKGAYSLHCFHPDKEQWVKAPESKKRKLEDLGEEEGGSKVARGDGAAGAGDEVDSITKAEQHVKQTKRVLTLHRAALEKAQAEYDAAKAAFEEDKRKGKKATPVKERLSDIHIPAEKMAEYEVPDAEKEWKGESDDRKGMLEFRQKLQARIKELAKAKEAYLKEERARREKEAKDSNKETKAVEIALRRTEKALQQERHSTETAEKAAAAAEKKLEKEKERAVRDEERTKEREEKEKQKLVEREEREKRRAEAAKAKEDAKRYPMEDLELLAELQAKAKETGEPAPALDVEAPCWLEAEESQRLATTLYVADFLSQFAKQLGLKAVSFEHMEKALADATSGAPNLEEDYSAATLHAIYKALIQFILDDLREEDEATAQEKRWSVVLSEGTWPEVLRRMVLTRGAEAEAEERPDLRPAKPATMAASMLAFDSVDSLTHDQHLALLTFLCDAALESEKMRGVLQRREDEATDVRRDIREEVAEQRKALKELLDGEKGERKRKREERRKAEEEEKAAADAAAAAAAGAEGEQQQQEQQQDGQKPAPMEVDGQAEPSFELPKRLREYGGPSDDKKLLLQWRQEQQAEKRRLEKERNRWVAEQLRRQREQEAAEKAAAQVEKAKQREKEEKEEAILRAQEELEAKLEKYSVRRGPLGTDRHHRCYWWGLAGHRSVVWVEDAEGRWGSFSSTAELDALLVSLNRRGVRELDLAETIERRYDSISMAMHRAERAAAAAGKPSKADKAKERAEPPRRSGRQTQQVDFFDPVAKGDKGAPSGLAALCGPAESSAVEAAAEQMLDLQKAAVALVPAPAACDSWKAWAAGVKAAAEGEPAGQKHTAAGVRAALQASLQQLEEALIGESVGGLAADGDDEGSEEAGGTEGADEAEEGSGEGGRSREQSVEVVEEVVDEMFSPTKRRDVAFLWKTQRERSAWQADVRQSNTVARVAYCAAVLAQQAGPMLATLKKQSGAGSGGKGSGKRPKSAQASGKAPAAASSRPVSRTNSAAALDVAAAAAAASKPGKGAAAGKRKAGAPPLPDNTRATRARH